MMDDPLEFADEIQGSETITPPPPLPPATLE
jgi:hypothetical protein